MAKKIGDKSCQSNFDTRASDFGSSLVYLITTVHPNKSIFAVFYTLKRRLSCNKCMKFNVAELAVLGDRSARRRTEARHIRDVVKLAKQVLYYFEQNHASSHQFHCWHHVEV